MNGTFNWTLGGPGSNDELDCATFRLLQHCSENRTVEPRDPSPEAIAEFQESVKRLRHAQERRLIDAWFSPPSRSPSHKGAIVFVVVNEILPRGKERMQAFEQRRTAASQAAVAPIRTREASKRAGPEPEERTVLV